MSDQVRQNTVAFIGLGHMGMPMAANLVRAGFRVQGFDLIDQSVAAAVGQGVQPTSSLSEAVAGADVVITMLPGGQHVLDAYSGDDGVLASAAPDALLIDCSTIDVLTARAVHEATLATGRNSLDAPVSGGVVGAEAGTLTFMVGGADEGFARAQAVLSAMGRAAIHCGAAGSGQAAKICNNMILGISMIAVSEAFVLAESLGLSHEALYEVASQSSGQCWALNVNCPVPGPVPASPANHGYGAGFTASLMLKDLTLAHEAALASGTPTALGHTSFDLYSQYVTEVDGTSDFSGIIRWIRDRIELDVERGSN